MGAQPRVGDRCRPACPVPDGADGRAGHHETVTGNQWQRTRGSQQRLGGAHLAAPQPAVEGGGRRRSEAARAGPHPEQPVLPRQPARQDAERDGGAARRRPRRRPGARARRAATTPARPGTARPRTAATTARDRRGPARPRPRPARRRSSAGTRRPVAYSRRGGQPRHHPAAAAAAAASVTGPALPRPRSARPRTSSRQSPRASARRRGCLTYGAASRLMAAPSRRRGSMGHRPP